MPQSAACHAGLCNMCSACCMLTDSNEAPGYTHFMYVTCQASLCDASHLVLCHVPEIHAIAVER